MPRFPGKARTAAIGSAAALAVLLFGPAYPHEARAASNPCAPKNPCAAKNPCAPNPCAAKNPCAANPCAANPCAPGAARGPQAKARMVSAEVVSYDAKTRRLTLNHQGKTLVTTVTPSTVVRLGTNVASPAALSKGARAVVSILEKGSGRQALYVYLAKGGAAGNPCGNPCAANPCAAKNPCAGKNPCAKKGW